MKILILLGHYLPGFKAGGPTRSIANLVEQLGDELDFHIVTGDRDLGDQVPYHGIEPRAWQRVGNAHVAYVSPSINQFDWLIGEVHCISPDVIYLNSFFDWQRSMVPLLLQRVGLLPDLPIVIAPRGQFGAGALRSHRWKKAPYLAAFKSLGLHRRVLWHATSREERRDIVRMFGPHTRIQTAPNISRVAVDECPARPAKQSGEVRLVFLSRVSSKKNLLGALDMVRSLAGRVSLDVYGPIEDRAYWQRCQETIARLPENVTVNYRGSVRPEQVPTTLAQFDAMLLPTYDENFGHVIVEALAAGCPVVISDRTPWHDLQQRGVGWDLPVESAEAFCRALAMLCSLDEPLHKRMRSNAAAYGRSLVRSLEAVAKHRKLFKAAATGRPAFGAITMREAA